jgi:hypothetical protein
MAAADPKRSRTALVGNKNQGSLSIQTFASGKSKIHGLQIGQEEKRNRSAKETATVLLLLRIRSQDSSTEENGVDRPNQRNENQERNK